MTAEAASKITFSGGGHVTAVAPYHPPVPPAAGNGPLLIGGGGIIAALLLGVGALMLKCRGRHSPATSVRRNQRDVPSVVPRSTLGILVTFRGYLSTQCH